ncbi:hypothetical protein J7L67_05445 [bacterium]|nr:hypothetical protein [bacterium]
MNKKYLQLFLISALLLFCMDILSAQDNSVKEKQAVRTRSIRYYPDGSIKSVTETYPNNQTVKKIYDETESLKEKILPDGSKIKYSFSSEDGQKTVTEYYDNDSIAIKRFFNKKNQIIRSVYPDYSEQYEYHYDNVGDIEKITIIKEDGSKEEIAPTDNRLSFLYDYAIIGADVIEDFSRISDKEYIYNPTRFKEKMMMHKKYNTNVPKY